MAKKKKRFEVVYQQGGLVDAMEILVDWQTGVNYLFRTSGTAGGLTVLLDQEGKPVVTSFADRAESAWEK